MTDRITSGPYVIRNRHFSTVLHIENSTVNSDYSKVVVFEQDENLYRDKQIWWIEPLPDPEADQEGVLYSITNTSCGKSLDQAPNGSACAARSNGGPWQTWRIRKLGNDDEGVYYTIIAPLTGRVITAPSPSAICSTNIYVLGNNRQIWEFAIPIVSFPIGWFQIQNAETGNLLSHKYPCNPPVLIPPPSPAQPSQNLESWGTQWTLTDVKSTPPIRGSATGKNSWYIMNRLTEGFLANPSNISEASKVTAWKRGWRDLEEPLWKLELDPACNWTIMYHQTSLLLEQTDVARSGGTEVACIAKRFTLGTRKSWVLTAPMLETSDEVRVYFRSLRDGDASEQLLIRRQLTTETSIKTTGSPGL